MSMGQVYIGSMGWSYKQWAIYDGLKSSEFLQKYSNIFNSVEINNTFYRIPKESTMIEWANKTPNDFRFSIKFPRSISHSKGLMPDQGRLEAFLSRVQLLENKTGPLLLQFPPAFNSSSIDKLETFLDRLPLFYNYAVEFRNAGWFNESTFKILRKYNIAIVNVEHPWQAFTEIQTADFSYIRLEGDRKTVKGELGTVEIDKTDSIMRWSEKILALSESRDVYCFVSKHYSGYPPSDIMQLQEKLGI
jgi:uncharacterized protein YecE (DUF72 family)